MLSKLYSLQLSLFIICCLNFNANCLHRDPNECFNKNFFLSYKWSKLKVKSSKFIGKGRRQVRKLSIFIACILPLFFYMQASLAYVVVTRHVIFSLPPESKSCDDVSAHWESDNVWAGPQTICIYEDRPEGTKLLSDYWACVKFTSSGNCTEWKFKPAHWLDPPTDNLKAYHN